MSANRLSAQNYCNSCSSRTTTAGKAFCGLSSTPIIAASQNCQPLKPFRVYKDFKNK
jgi:hypothetical protein